MLRVAKTKLVRNRKKGTLFLWIKKPLKQLTPKWVRKCNLQTSKVGWSAVFYH